MAELNKIKIQKIKVAGLPVYPATILDAVKDATAKLTVNGQEVDNPSYGKTLREILAAQAEGTSADVQKLEEKLYGKVAVGVEGEEGYVPAVEGDIPAAEGRLAALEDLHADKTNEEGTVIGKKTVSEEVSEAIADVVAEAPESFDTLKEIADWIQKDAQNETGFDAAQRIVNLEDKVGEAGVKEERYAEGDELPEGKQIGDVKVEGKEASGLYKAIEEAVADASSAINDLEVEETTVKNAESDEVVSFKYKEENGIVTISDLNVVTSTLGEVGLTLDENGKWVEGSANEAKGLATAADVAAELVNDEKVIAGALNDLNDRLAAFEDGDASVAKQITDAIDTLDVEETTVGEGNVTVTYSEENGKVAISEVAVAETTATFSEAVEASEGVEAAPAKLEVATADAGKLLNAGSIAAIKNYVDYNFSTEDLSDADEATAEYDDVF